MNGGTNQGQFTLSEGSGPSSIASVLKQTETTLMVHWSGGGQIKSESEKWTLETLMRAAAAFPAKVAACPQRTHAILTKYSTNLSFVAYAKKNKIRLRDYSMVSRYTNHLLDTYMEYKNNLARLQRVLGDPKGFKLAPVANPINIGFDDLVGEKEHMKKAMTLIVFDIDQM